MADLEGNRLLRDNSGEILRRNFYVNDKLEFSLFCRESDGSKDKILKDFLDHKDWKSICNYCNWKFSSAKFSKDLLRVDIVVK